MAYSKEAYQKAEQELQKRRNSALTEREMRHSKIASEFPELSAIEEKMVKAGLDTIKAVGMKSEDSKKYIESLAVTSLKAQAERKQLLKNAGYPEDYLDVKYTCKKCEDKGIVNGFFCDCFKTLIQSFEYENLCSGLPVNSFRFDNFRLDFYPDGGKTSPRARMESVLSYCREYAEDFRKSSPNLLLYGKTGLGKTHLSLAIAGKVIEHGYGVVYTSAQNLFNKLEKEKFGRINENTEESIFNCDLLIIDDLGAEFVTGFTTSAVYNIINTRCLEGNPTIINTNLSQKELSETYNDRIASRIFSGFVQLYFDGEDIRQLKSTR